MADEAALDRTDRAIVTALQHDARMSNRDLAAAVGLAPSSCLARVRRLRERGVLLGFHAEVDPAALGRPLQALVSVRMTRHDRHMVDSFREHVLGLADVIEIYHLTGNDDFLVHVAVRDPDALRDLILDQFTTRREVARTVTSLIFERVPRRPEPPA